MKKKTILLTALIGITLLSIQTFASQNYLSCGGDYKLPGQFSSGQNHNDVERAGGALLKDYGIDDRILHDRYAIFLGHDKNLGTWLPQAGKVENNDQYTTQTASREIEEETGGLIKYSSKQLQNFPYIYAGQKQLFLIYDPGNSNLSVNKITQACKNAQNSNLLPTSYQEIDEVCAVSLLELMKVAKQINQGTLGRQATYTLEKRSQRDQSQNPVTIQIDGYYMRMFATRYNEVCQIFNQTFQTNIFQ
jgi:8-oxo-dGTP pyrophosphatase MutT (NUDIX family)